MKKRICLFITLLSSLFLIILPLAGCAKADYFSFVSDLKGDLFCAETEDYSVTVSCLEREYPYNLDGYVGEKSKTVEVDLHEKNGSSSTFEVYFLEDIPRGGEMSFQSVTGNWYYSRGVEKFPENTLSLRIVHDKQSEDIALTSVKNEKTVSSQEALLSALASEKEVVQKLTSGSDFLGEIHVRLLRRDKNYYYVGIVDREKKTISLLIDANTGEVLARREKQG